MLDPNRIDLYAAAPQIPGGRPERCFTDPWQGPPIGTQYFVFLMQAQGPHYRMTQPSASDASLTPTATPPQQQEMPLALVHGQPVLQIPQDLYIPPDALEVILESFEGPLDLLLYLIRRQNLDILDIPVAEITRQYVDYISVMQELRFELAAEYLVMAAILAEIKSRLLVRRLQEYERFKKAAEDIDTLDRLERDTTPVHAFAPEVKLEREPPPVDMKELLAALVDVLKRADLYTRHAIRREALSVRQRMGDVLARIDDGQFHPFDTLFTVEEGRLGVIVTFLSILELAKERLVEIVQEQQFAPIYLRSLAVAPGEGQDALADAHIDDYGGDEAATQDA